MAVYVDKNDALVCRKCDQPFPPVAQFCTSCGASRAIALGQELDPAEALEKQQREENERIARLEAEKLLREEERRAKKEQRAEATRNALSRHGFKIRFTAGLVGVAIAYFGMQYAIFTKTAPNLLINDYVAAVEERDFSALQDPRLFPLPSNGAAIAPDNVLAELSAPTDSSEYTLTWQPMDSFAKVKIYGGEIELVSDDKWNFIFREHVWRVKTLAPTLEIGAASGVSSRVSAASFGANQVSLSEISRLSSTPDKYVVLPGTIMLQTVGLGFTDNWREVFTILSGQSTEATFSFGSSSVPANAMAIAAKSAATTFRSCGSRNNCGYTFVLADFGIDYPWYYENGWYDDSFTSSGCTMSASRVLSSTSASVDFDCSGTVSRSVTWLITSYTYIADDYEYDSGYATLDVSVTVNLKYNPKTNKTSVSGVSY